MVSHLWKNIPSLNWASSMTDMVEKIMVRQAELESTVRMVRQMDKNYLAFIQPTLELIDYITDRVGYTIELYGLIMLENRWPPDINMSLEEARAIERVNENEGWEAAAQYIRDHMLQKYNIDALQNLYEEWSNRSWFKHRLPLLSEAIEAHIEGRYALSVPVFLAQTEGIIADGYGHKGRLNHRRGNKHQSNECMALTDYLEDLLSSKDVLALDQFAKDYFLKNVLEGFRHGVFPMPSLSRHAIMHGADVSYNTIENSLKCILLFEYLQCSFRFVGLHGSSIYHTIDCPSLQRSKGTKRYQYKDYYEAENDGRRPCKMCVGLQGGELTS